MRTVELVPGVRSSVLGFGCAPILGSVNGSLARRALDVALDEGVTHFDVAPSYGYGEAEAWLGKALAGHRDSIVVATKFGIFPTSLARWLRPIKPVVRWLRGRSRSKVSATVPSTQGDGLGTRLLTRATMDPALMRRSVESSLRALRTDRLDFLLLHDPLDINGAATALTEEADRLKKTGKLRAWGVAGMRSRHNCSGGVLDAFDVLQFDLAPGTLHYARVKASRSDRSNIFFSPFRGLGPGVAHSEVLPIMARDFPRSVILCSMFDPVHIRANARSL